MHGVVRLVDIRPAVVAGFEWEKGLFITQALHCNKSILPTG